MAVRGDINRAQATVFFSAARPVIMERAQDLDAQAIFNVMWAHVAANYDDADVLSALSRAARSKADSFAFREIAGVLLTLSKAKFFDEATFFGEFASASPLQGFSTPCYFPHLPTSSLPPRAPTAIATSPTSPHLHLALTSSHAHPSPRPPSQPSPKRRSPFCLAAAPAPSRGPPSPGTPTTPTWRQHSGTSPSASPAAAPGTSPRASRCSTCRDGRGFRDPESRQ